MPRAAPLRRHRLARNALGARTATLMAASHMRTCQPPGEYIRREYLAIMQSHTAICHYRMTPARHRRVITLRRQKERRDGGGGQ